MKKSMAVSLILVGVMLAALASLAACTSAPGTPTTNTPTGATPTETTPQTLKIGVISWLGWDTGADLINGLKVMTDMDNQNGGLLIGGKKYPIQLVSYDSGTNYMSTQNIYGNAPQDVINRLIFTDKVNFILSDPSGVDTWLKLTEANKVVLCAASPTSPIVSANNQYSFEAGFMNNQPVALAKWFAKAFPGKNNIVVALPDDPRGHQVADINQRALEASVMKVTTIFYPSPSTGIPSVSDLDPLANQVINLNPDVFMATGGLDPSVYQAVWDHGYRGQFISQLPLSNLTKGLSNDALEGLIGITTPAEFDPPLTPTAQAFKQAYAGKYTWDSAGVQYLGVWGCLRAGLQKAASLDPAKVSAALSSGVQFEGPFGLATMVSRPDKQNNRTVDSVVAPYFYKVSGGKATNAGNFTLDEAVSNFQQFYK
jgi:branched-chain amino acid transport system substrate-binding protein